MENEISAAIIPDLNWNGIELLKSRVSSNKMDKIFS